MHINILNRFFIFLFGLFIGFVGLILPLMFMYTMPDYTPSPLAGSIVLLGILLIHLSLLYKFKEIEIKLLKYGLILLSFYFIIIGIILGLVSIYSLSENKSYSIAASLYFFGSLIHIAGIILLGKNVNENQ